jgi:hypothetical protein
VGSVLYTLKGAKQRGKLPEHSLSSFLGLGLKLDTFQQDLKRICFYFQLWATLKEHVFSKFTKFEKNIFYLHFWAPLKIIIFNGAQI